MEYKVEKFQMSPSLTVTTSKSGNHLETYRSSTPMNKESNELKLPEEDTDHSGKPHKADVVLNLCPERNELNISIDGANLNATKTSFNATIGNFSIAINFLDDECFPLPQSRAAIINIPLGKPLFVVLGDSPSVTATISQSK